MSFIVWEPAGRDDEPPAECIRRAYPGSGRGEGRGERGETDASRLSTLASRLSEWEARLRWWTQALLIFGAALCYAVWQLGALVAELRARTGQ
jgi:hypothetical protein